MNDLLGLDWSLVRSFLAVAETGSLSAAARALGSSQPTLGRHVAALEAALGVALFERRRRGLVPTEAARALMPEAAAMRRAAGRLALAAAGRDTRLAGTVRITTSVAVAHHLMPAIVAGLRRDAPEIEIELVASDTSENLLFREADIAVRMYRPAQLDVVTRHLGEFELGLFAARGYIARAGMPEGPAGLDGHVMVGFDRSDLIREGVRALGLDPPKGFFAVRCDDQGVCWELLRAGCGIGVAHAAVARAEPGLVRVLPELALPRLPVWLTAPLALRTSPRIRFVFDRLAAALEALAAP